MGRGPDPDPHRVSYLESRKRRYFCRGGSAYDKSSSFRIFGTSSSLTTFSITTRTSLVREIPRSFAASCRYSISKGITSSGSAIPRLNGAGSLSRSDLIRNSFGASPKSQIAVPQSRNCGWAIAVGLRAQSRLPGTEFLDAETKRQKSPLKCANAYRDQNPGSEWPENPVETPYLAPYR